MQSSTLLRRLYFFVISLSFTWTERCPIDTMDVCRCGYTLYNRERYYVVNCTDTKFRTTDMLKILPPHTQVLIFTGNYIPELPWNVFGELNSLSNLTIIDMSNNGIREIRGKSYHHVPNVQRLILNHNNLSISNQFDGNFHHPRVFSNFVNLLELHLTDAFADNTDSALANDLHDIFVNSNLSQLYKLHLEQNEIRSFRDERVFCDLPNIHDLYLGDNFITGLNFNINCLKKLRFLDLEHNNISYFTSRELNQFDKLSFPYRNESLILDVGSNPFKCGADLHNFCLWLQNTNVTVRNKDMLECKQDTIGKKYILQYVYNSRPARVSHMISGLLITLVLILITLICVLLYLNRKILNGKFRPVFEVVSRKVQYTTIQSQDV